MKTESTSKPYFFAAAGLAAGLLVAFGVWIGKIPAPGANGAGMSAEAMAEQMLLHAGAGNSNDAFSVCTGPLDDGEGLFMLDFVTGELTVVAIHPRTGNFRARLGTNVVAALGADATKKPRYLMTSGVMDFPRGGGANRPASSVIYVVDANTGNFAAYGIPWNPNLWNSGSPISAQLTLLDAGRARTVAVGE